MKHTKSSTLAWMFLFANLLVSTHTFAMSTVNSTANNTSSTAPLSDAELEQILAPIALYPDSLLSHIVIASTYPLQVVEAQRWQAEHSHFLGFRYCRACSN